MMMTMLLLKMNRFGISMMVFMFLLSFATAAVDVSGVSYIGLPLSDTNWETKLNDQINAAKGKGQRFFIGVACAVKQQKSTLDALCSRQGSKPFGDRCGGESNHHKDVEVAKDKKLGVKLAKVYYPNTFKSKTDVYAIEKSLIAKYFNTGKVDPLCLNRQSGKESCSDIDSKGIVYLRVYEKGNVYSDEL